MKVKIYDRIKVRTIEYFNSVKMNLSFDAIASSFSFDFYFDPNNEDHAELACVSHYHEAIIEHEGQQILQGFILSQTFTDSSEKKLSQFSGYSRSGVLEDCQIPPELYPLQYNGLSLRQIAEKLLKPFSIGIKIDLEVEEKMNIKYAETTVEPTTTIKEYLTTLAAQRNIILSHDEFGNLLFTKLNTKTLPIFNVDEGLIGYEMSLSFGGQPMHSHITVMKQADSDSDNAGEYTIKNPFVPVAHVYRPKVVIQSSGNDNDTKEVAENALAAELKNIVLTISIDRWEIDGQFIRPNSMISVLNKELYIYKRTKFFIESISYEGDSEGQRATLICVLPCCYDGSTPVNIFVDPHTNSGLRS
jgi:prophage tail gpP-like protein